MNLSKAFTSFTIDIRNESSQMWEAMTCSLGFDFAPSPEHVLHFFPCLSLSFTEVFLSSSLLVAFIWRNSSNHLHKWYHSEKYFTWVLHTGATSEGKALHSISQHAVYSSVYQYQIFASETFSTTNGFLWFCTAWFGYVRLKRTNFTGMHWQWMSD